LKGVQARQQDAPKPLPVNHLKDIRFYIKTQPQKGKGAWHRGKTSGIKARPRFVLCVCAHLAHPGKFSVVQETDRARRDKETPSDKESKNRL